MFCEENLPKINNTSVIEKPRRILISKTSMVRLTGLSLYANEPCDEHAPQAHKLRQFCFNFILDPSAYGFGNAQKSSGSRLVLTFALC